MPVLFFLCGQPNDPLVCFHRQLSRITCDLLVWEGYRVQKYLRYPQNINIVISKHKNLSQQIIQSATVRILYIMVGIAEKAV